MKEGLSEQSYQMTVKKTIFCGYFLLIIKGKIHYLYVCICQVNSIFELVFIPIDFQSCASQLAIIATALTVRVFCQLDKFMPVVKQEELQNIANCIHYAFKGKGRLFILSTIVHNVSCFSFVCPSFAGYWEYFIM